MKKGGFVYIVSNPHRTVLYIGVTSELYERIKNHKNKQGSTFTKEYNCVDLLFYEFHQTIEAAINREKQLKRWNRKWKEDLIQKANIEMRDLYFDLNPNMDL